MDEIRWDLIRHIREQIASGTYVTRRRLEITADRVTDALVQSGEIVENQVDADSKGASDLDLEPFG